MNSSTTLPYLDISLETLLQESVNFKRNWFSIIRQARENAGHSYPDIFSTKANLRSWAGLSTPIPTTPDCDTNTCSTIVQ